MNWCCATWTDLEQELAGMKVAQLEKLLKRGIPKSTFSPVFKIIEGMGNFCPLCGGRINEAIQEAPKKHVEPKKSVESKVPEFIKCPPCRGTGKVGDGLNCMTCFGTGKIDKSNPHRMQFDGAFAAEQSEKLERTNRGIVQLEKEIQKNPKPLREDAKQENWVR